MLETYLARVEPSSLFTPYQEERLTKWTMSIEASCWLRSLESQLNDKVELFIEYSDSLRDYRKSIDKANAHYFQDCLLSGRFILHGFGELVGARLVVESDGPVECIDLRFKEIGTKPERYKLVA